MLAVLKNPKVFNAQELSRAQPRERMVRPEVNIFNKSPGQRPKGVLDHWCVPVLWCVFVLLFPLSPWWSSEKNVYYSRMVVQPANIIPGTHPRNVFEHDPEHH